MRFNVSIGRVAMGSVVLAAVVAGSGCGWWRDSNKLYADDAAKRPLEVPPELDRGVATPSGASVTASGTVGTQPMPAGSAVAATGFTVGGTRDDTFTKVGEALAKVEGVTIASRAQLLGAFDVNYGGSNFLVRVTAVEAGAYVSAVDPRGVPATGEAPAKLVASLKEALGGR